MCILCNRANCSIVRPAALAHLACCLLYGHGNAVSHAPELALAGCDVNIRYTEYCGKLVVCGKLCSELFVNVECNTCIERLTDNAGCSLLLKSLENIVADSVDAAPLTP